MLVVGRGRCGGVRLLVFEMEMVGVLGSWFSNNLRLNVGNDANTLFWLDRWMGDVPLCVRFRRLYELSENKMAIVAHMFGWGWDKGGEAWKWRRMLWA